jgi:hypothetical protein
VSCRNVAGETTTTPEFRDPGSDQTPSGRLFYFLKGSTSLGLPLDGWSLDPALDVTLPSAAWARYVHRTGHRLTGVLLLHQSHHFWRVSAYAVCGPAELDPFEPLSRDLAPWRDDAGSLISTQRLGTQQGPGHCGWASTTWLLYRGQSFVRDPLGVLKDSSATTFETNTSLPAGAVRTGYHSWRFALWRGSSATSVYVVTGNRVERWPRTAAGCA